MADQNLLNDDDFFAKALESLDEKPSDKKEKKEEVYSEEDNLFKPQNLDEQSAEELAYIESSLQERSDSPKATGSKDFLSKADDLKETAPVAKSIDDTGFDQTPSKQGDLNYKQVYFDMEDEQEKVSYKPFFITVLVLIIVGVGGYFAYDLYLRDNVISKLPFFKSDQPTELGVTEEPIDTDQSETTSVDEPPQLSPAEKQKIDYLSKLAGETNQNVNSIANVISISRKIAKLSSVLVYDSDIILEVFGKSQQDLANLNTALKKSSGISNIKMVPAGERIGANSGVLGVYSAKLVSAGSSGKQVTLKLAGNNEAGNWLKDILTNNKLKVSSFKNRSTKNQNTFKVFEIEAVAKGSIDACLSAINAFAVAEANVKIYKLTCSAIDQTNFSTANYQLKLVIKVYV